MGTPSSAPGPFIVASGPWEQAKTWQCEECAAHGDLAFMNDAPPRAHVVSTGHSVVMTWTTEATLSPARTQPPG